MKLFALSPSVVAHLLFMLVCTSLTAFTPYQLCYPHHVDYIEVTVEHPLVHDLINSKAFQRLYAIHQYGVDRFFITRSQPLVYTRAEHSLRVYEILRRFGATLEECIAGLLHDASHGVFSHLIELVMGEGERDDAYQDIHHLDILSKTDIPAILARHGYDLSVIDHKSGRYCMLEQPNRMLCADRIEYILSGGIIEGRIDEHQAREILQHLAWHPAEQCWYFTDSHSAYLFADSALYNTEHVWGNAPSRFYSYYTAQAIKRALQIGLLTYDDIMYGVDDDIWHRLWTHDDEHLNQYRLYLTHQPNVVSDPIQRTIYHKFRGVDPYVLQEDGRLILLSQLDPAFRTEYQQLECALKRYNQDILH